MKRSNLYNIGLILVNLLMSVGIGFCQPEREWPQVNLSAQDRILILAPHPDDEILGCAGIIQKAKKMGLPVRIVFFTYGDNNEWSFMVYRKRPVVMPNAVRNMGLIRHDEALEADNVLDILPQDITFLGYPDFGTIDIWYRHWNESPSFTSMLTKVRAVPYKNAFRPGALYKGEEILKDISAILKEFQPTKIFLSHPGDHNGDHRSLYLFTRVALWELKAEKEPELYPYLIHYKKWPLPRGHFPEKQLWPPELFSEQISWMSELLDTQEINRKEEALKKHRSQYESAAAYLDSFVRSNELFGDFSLVYIGIKAPAIKLSGDNAQNNLPEQLTDEERAAFVGFEEHYVYLEEVNIALSIKLSRSLGKEVGVSVYLFGYRSDIPFAQMPKLHLDFGALTQATFYDQRKRLYSSGIRISRTAKEITVSVPLKILGNPDKILTSANTYLGNVPLDWVSWRILELPISK